MIRVTESLKNNSHLEFDSIIRVRFIGEDPDFTLDYSEPRDYNTDWYMLWDKLVKNGSTKEEASSVIEGMRNKRKEISDRCEKDLEEISNAAYAAVMSCVQKYKLLDKEFIENMINEASDE